ncbi:MAG TPA: PIN domain-containing protein [Candidatus Norongarragalinales archaeon]|nr:PIN domain-containing protein [Candidatus Norongarragalinales archaeon]
MGDAFFFDSYALVEILRGNQAYSKYLSSAPVTTKLNLFEVCHALLRETSLNEAEDFLDDYYAFAFDFDKEAVLEAAVLRFKLKKRNLSMTDCIGYILSQRLGIPFLTGDEQFKDLPNVEFVK